ncbi:hypothetical protein AgCh_011926 [Apium graveolens]
MDIIAEETPFPPPPIPPFIPRDIPGPSVCPRWVRRSVSAVRDFPPGCGPSSSSSRPPVPPSAPTGISSPIPYHVYGAGILAPSPDVQARVRYLTQIAIERARSIDPFISSEYRAIQYQDLVNLLVFELDQSCGSEIQSSELVGRTSIVVFFIYAVKPPEFKGKVDLVAARIWLKEMEKAFALTKSQMEMEFLELKQEDRSVTEYEAKFIELSRITPEYAALVIESDQRLATKEQAHIVKPSSSKPKRTKTVPQTPQKRRRIVLRDESDSEEQVPASEPIVTEAEKVSFQKETGIGGFKLLKRLRRMSYAETPKESPSSKKRKQQRAHRPVSDDEEAAAKVGDQESLISKEVAYIEKTQEKQQSQIDEILKNQASQQSQLDEIQSSVELLVSLFLPADAKKGEKVLKSKCKIVKTLKGKDDEKDDQGNSRMGGGHSQGRGLSSRRAEATSHRASSDTGKRITSDTSKRISSDELLDLDEEISRQLFLKENPGMDFESLLEEEARLKSEKVNSKSEASVGKKKLPKVKGIVIKERTNIEATKAKSQLQIDLRLKGKEKVGEPIKVYVPPVDEEITVEDVDLTLTLRKISKTTSDMAQVVQSQDIVTKKQVTSDIAQVDLISEDK